MPTRSSRKPRTLSPAVDVPDFDSEGAAAQWYDTHDTSDLITDPVSGESGDQPAALETVAVRVATREVRELKRRAARLGIGYTTYVRMLINRHVLEEAPLG